MSQILKPIQILGTLFEEFKQSTNVEVAQGIWQAAFDENHSLVIQVLPPPSILLHIVRNPYLHGGENTVLIGMGFFPPDVVIYAPLPLCTFDDADYPRLRAFVARSRILYSASKIRKVEIDPKTDISARSDLNADRILN